MLKPFDKIHNTLSTVENNGLLLPGLGSCFYFFFSFYPTPRRLVRYSYKILDTFPKNYPFLQKYTTKLYKPKKTTEKSRIFEPPREMKICSKNQELEKSKVTSNHTCFTTQLKSFSYLARFIVFILFCVTLTK